MDFGTRLVSRLYFGDNVAMDQTWLNSQQNSMELPSKFRLTFCESFPEFPEFQDMTRLQFVTV